MLPTRGVVLGSSAAVTVREELPLILGYRKIRVCGGWATFHGGMGFGQRRWKKVEVVVGGGDSGERRGRMVPVG